MNTHSDNPDFEKHESVDEPDETATPTDGTPVATVFPTVTDFVEQYLTVIYNRKIHQATRLWCPQWWKHTELVIRFVALWQSWEFQHAEGGAEGLARWIVQFADPIMESVFSPSGPLKGCSLEEHRDAPNAEYGYRLPTDEAPDELA